MPDVQDAIRVVTDPANVVVATDTHSDVRLVKNKQAVKALRGQGAGKAEARELIREAVENLGGRVDSRVRADGRAVGPDTRTAVERFYVPVKAIR